MCCEEDTGGTEFSGTSVRLDCSVEECSLAIGEVVRHRCINSASRMNSAIVVFLETTEKVNEVVEQGIVINDEHISVFPLVNPVKKVVISNVPPCSIDKVIECELASHGQMWADLHSVVNPHF